MKLLAMTAALCLCLPILGEAQGHWLDVPFVKQPADGCGAASVAMVMQYWEQHRGERPSASSEVAHIQQAIYSRQAQGAYASAVEKYLQKQGYDVYAVNGDLALLAHHLERGRPLIVALKPSGDPRLHYVVVAGIDPQEDVVLMNDPAQRKLLKMNTADFTREWKATKNWTLLAVPHERTR